MSCMTEIFSFAGINRDSLYIWMIRWLLKPLMSNWSLIIHVNLWLTLLSFYNVSHELYGPFMSYRTWFSQSFLLYDWTQKENIKVCLWNTGYAPGGNKVKKAIFSFKVKVKVTRSLTLVSFERAPLVEYACQISSLYLLRFKNYSEG